MKNNIGIWIDQEKALMVVDGTNDIVTVPSDLEKVFPTSGSHGTTGIGGKDYIKDASLDRKLEKFRHVFYKELLKKVQGHDHVFIIGPGETKTEFANFLKENGAGDKVKKVLPADKLTPNQLVAKFSEMFG